MKDQTIKFRCTPSEKTRIKLRADSSGYNVSEYCRQIALSGKILAIPKLTPEHIDYFKELKNEQGEASPDDILELREMFDYQRDNAGIKALRQRVEYYERLVKEQAEREARAKLNNDEAEKLKEEAEKIKTK